MVGMFAHSRLACCKVAYGQRARKSPSRRKTGPFHSHFALTVERRKETSQQSTACRAEHQA